MLSPGARLGSYEIVGSLGAGGMGEVYRARDPRLDREVAIKVLAPQVAGDAVSIARFEREAMSVAKLSHPNVLSIFEFVNDGRTAFVVTELVDGDTLRARLQNGPLPQRRAVAYALQIAKGIAAAHARGIVHRDLKPENVMVTRDDQIKILDFGLAKPIGIRETDATVGGAVATNAGTVLGTCGCMAPEQVRGLAADHRADMFAFGAVLYEMLSGQRAFGGATAADTMTAVLTKEPPDLDVARLAIAPGLDRIVRRCLEKTPELRFQSANDLAFALETLSTASTSSSIAMEPPVAARRAPVSWVPWTVAALAVAAAVASRVINGAGGKTEANWDTFTRITETAGEETSPTLSPDGSTIAYAARAGDSWAIFSQRVGGRNAVAIVNDAQRDEGGPAFSPDGSLIAFHESDADGGIFVAGATGESVRRLTDIGFEPAWSPDGKQIAFSTEEIRDPASRFGVSSLYVVDVAGGVPRKIVDGDGVQPSWSPAGDRIVYWSNTGGQRDIFTVAAAGGPRVPVTSDPAIDWSPVWSPDGRFIYFSSDRGGAMNLWRIAVDRSGRPRSAPEAVTAGVQASAGLPRFSKDGSRLAFCSRVSSVNPTAIPFDPVAMTVGTPFALDTRNNFRLPSEVSRDGKQIAYSSQGERQEDLFIGPPGGGMRRVTDDPPRDRGPVFTPDARSLLFYSNRDGNWAAWTIGVDGGGLREVAKLDAGIIDPILSPKGDRMVFANASGNAVYTAPFPAGTPVTKLPGTSINGLDLVPSGWSPDGMRLAGALQSPSGRGSAVGIYDVAAGATTMVSADQTTIVRWLADNRRVVYFTDAGAKLVVLDAATRLRRVLDVALPGPSVDDVFAVSPDNRTIYYGATRTEADIWIVERSQK